MNLVLRQSSRLGRNQGSLSLRLIHNRRSKTLTLPDCRLYPEEWDTKEKVIIYPENNPRRVAYLEKIERRINQEMDVLKSFIFIKQEEGRYNIDDLINTYRLHKDDGKLLSYVKSISVEMERRGQVRTARAYLTVTRGLVRFNGGDISLNQITLRLIKDFESHLKDHRKMPNTISYYMRNLRAIYNRGVKDKRIMRRHWENPFEGVYMGVTRTMKRSLSFTEIKKLHDLDFLAMQKNEKPLSRESEQFRNLHTAKRYFEFCFYARGMCFIDLAYMKKDNIRSGILRYVRKKTGQQIEIKVNEDMKQIIDSFADDVKGSPYLFPIIPSGEKNPRLRYETSLKNQNALLKRIASLAGIKKPVSTHWARHSWATLAKQLDVSLRVISECMGHSSEKTTLIYLHSLENSVLDEANDLIASAIKGADLHV